MIPVIIIGMILVTITAIVLYAQKSRALKLISDLNDDINRLNASNFKLNSEVKVLDTKLMLKDRELFNMTTQRDTLSDINKELSKKLSKDEKIEVTVTGENSNVQITDVDGKATVKRRGRKPGSKKPFYKKKSGGKPS